jgi:hypothetical protein
MNDVTELSYLHVKYTYWLVKDRGRDIKKNC